MLHRLSLKNKIFIQLGFLILTAILGGSTLLWLNRTMSSVLKPVLDEILVTRNTSQDVHSSVLAQMYSLSGYISDGRSTWLDELERERQISQEKLNTLRSRLLPVHLRDHLRDMESKYHQLQLLMNRALSSVQSGEQHRFSDYNRTIYDHFLAFGELFKHFQQESDRELRQLSTEANSLIDAAKTTCIVFILVELLLGSVFTYTLYNRVWEPVRRMLKKTGVDDSSDAAGDEMRRLEERVRILVEHVDQTESELQISREHLIQSGKLAMVGKLAAGVAHSIRNPLTSVKMRMFSLGRTLELTPAEKEDFEVIAEEIRHIDTILQNFLEFSRPPKLKIQKISPSDVVDSTIQLLHHRIESYGVTVELYRKKRLPPIEGDPEQLKEVLANLIINACEAMSDGGVIVIQEEEGFSDPMGRVVVIKVSDNGPGIPESIREKIFQPFFSTKEEGTGLGLSIAVRIIEDHKGCLNLRSKRGKGSTFIITIPCKEGEAWLRS